PPPPMSAAGWTSSPRPDGRCGCPTPGGSGGWRSRTSACCATPWGWRCRSGCQPPSPAPSPTRSANSWAATPAPGGRSPPRRRRSLAALRAQVGPVSTAAFGRFLPAWQQVGTANSGIDGLAAVIEQLAGVPMPASAVESLILPQRVRDYQPAMLDELLASGEVIWSGAGAIGGGATGADGWIAFHLGDSAPLTLAEPAEIEFTDVHRAILDTLGGGGGYFFRQLAGGAGTDTTAVRTALWELVWAGWVTGDTFAPVRAMLSGAGRTGRRGGAPAHRQSHR